MLTKTTLLKAVQQAANYGKEAIDAGRQRVASVMEKDSPWRDAREAPVDDEVLAVLWDGHGYWRKIVTRTAEEPKHKPPFKYEDGTPVKVDVVWFSPMPDLPEEAQ